MERFRTRVQKVMIVGAMAAGLVALGHQPARAVEPTGKVAFGINLAPEFLVSQDYDGLSLRETKPTNSGFGLDVGPGLGALQLKADVVPSQNFLAGPLIDYRRSRDDTRKDFANDRRSMDGAVELGGFVGYAGSLPGAAEQGYLTDLQFAKDVSGEHGGWLVQPGIGYWRSFGDAWRFSSRLSTTYASENYMASYFGVDRGEASRSGMREFNADAGFRDVGFGLGLGYTVSPSWLIEGRGAYTRLIGAAAASPMTEDENNTNQLFGGVLIKYNF